MKRVKVKPRKVNMETVRTEDGKMIYPGDSVHTVPCPEHIARGMRQNLRRAALGGVTVVNKARRTAAWNVMKECKITTKRKKKGNRRKAS